MPLAWPSFQAMFKAYLPTGFTSFGLAGSLYIGNSVADCLAGSPGLRWWVLRSSVQVAQGQASRSHWKAKWVRWPSSHSMSIPVPVVTLTLTDLGLMTAIWTSIYRAYIQRTPKGQGSGSV